ncbi:hypothetical protein WQ54_02420 [Bacillus sp. SA1-12]|uniref:hypothetical protein n=1 Tax=Bacillus sp. SA1-12 TaxID=1455638 RepID=UPI0006262098|nr:hypothetical protein [Bacillus sp. SA1-12]KKI93918.1 hypothetical protein WQ54_02420 [Bacillus sp. SA1-12]
MIKYSTLLLFISFIFLILNGSSIGFILYQERLGDLFGITLFCCTSLLGALLSSIAFENQSTYYSNLFFYSHLAVTLLPFYYYGISAFLMKL